MKIAVIGPGAMGILFASRFRDSGAEVTLIDRDPARAAVLSASGVSVEEKDGRVTVRLAPVDTPETSGGCFDLAIVTVKAAQTESASKAAARILSPSGVALTLQNGTGGAEILSSTLGPGRVLVGVTAQGATLLGPGRVRHGGDGSTVIGPFAKDAKPRGDIVDLFAAAGLETRWEGDILPPVWRKLAVNCGINAITALTGAKNAIVSQCPDAAAVASEAVREVWNVARAQAIDLGDPGELAAQVLAVAEKTGRNRSSMGQDVDRGRPTEIEFINGAVVRSAKSLAVPVPVNETLASLVRALEWTYTRS